MISQHDTLVSNMVWTELNSRPLSLVQLIADLSVFEPFEILHTIGSESCINMFSVPSQYS